MIGYFKTLNDRNYKSSEAGELLHSGEFVQETKEGDVLIAKKATFTDNAAELMVVGVETEAGTECVLFEVTKEFPVITYMVEQQTSPLVENGLQEPDTAVEGELVRMKVPKQGEMILLEVEDASTYTVGKKVTVSAQIVPQPTVEPVTPDPDSETPDPETETPDPETEP